MFKKNKHRIFLLLGILTLVIGSIRLEHLKPTMDIRDYNHMGVVVILVGFSLIFVWAMIAAFKAEEKHEKEVAKGTVPIFESNCTHISGLASFTAEGKIRIYVDRIHFTVAGTHYELPLERIRSADILTQKQTEYITTQKLGRAVLGGLIFGDIGALIGSMPKSTAIETTEENLVISYTKEDNIEFIVLKNLPCNKVIHAIEQNAILAPIHVDL